MGWDMDAVLRNISFIGGSLIMLGIGSGYAYSSYSQTLADMLGFTQTEVNLIPSIGGAGMYLAAIVCGFLMDRLGPTVTVLFSGLLMTLGWILMYLGSLQKISSIPVAFGIYYAILQFGNQGAFFAAFVGNVKNFPAEKRGTINGLLVSLYGLSALIISQIYLRVFNGDVPTLFAFMAFFTGSLSIMGACTLRLVSLPADTAQPIVKALDPVIDDNPSSTETPEYFLIEQTPSPPPEGFEEAAVPKAPAHPPARYGDLRYLSLLSNFDFILICIIGFTAAGAGLTFITTVGSVADSWGVSKVISKPTYVSVLSICNAAGRIIYGLLNDRLRKWVRAPVFLIPICVVTGTLHFLMAWINSPSILMLGAIFTGLSYGGFFATVNLIINRYFGDKYYSSNLGFNTLAISFSGLIWGLVAGKIYDHFATPEGNIKRCHGPLCYRYTFMLTTGLCVLGLLCAITLVIRERRDDKKRKENPEYQKLIN